MINFDSQTYQENLLLTQAYCKLQINRTDKNLAAILRSFNPVYNEKHIFSFEPAGRYFTAKWLISPVAGGDKLYNQLFDKQLKHKKSVVKHIGPNLKAEGRVLIAEIDMTVVDGASEAQSEGIVDINDCPPIDTWFYLKNNGDDRLLFCWIPQHFVELVTKGVEVNCVNCLYWYDENEKKNETNPDLVNEDSNNKIKETIFKNIWHRLKRILSR